MTSCTLPIPRTIDIFALFFREISIQPIFIDEFIFLSPLTLSHFPKAHYIVSIDNKMVLYSSEDQHNDIIAFIMHWFEQHDLLCFPFFGVSLPWYQWIELVLQKENFLMIYSTTQCSITDFFHNNGIFETELIID